jgi:hypothetical protein
MNYQTRRWIMFAVVTVLGLLKFTGLLAALVMVVSLFVWAINSGGFLGWWMANDMLNIAGVILEAIGTAITSLLSDR